MAEPKQVKVIKGGLNIAKRLLDDGEGAGLTASQRAEAGRKAAELIKSQEQVKASEALGQLMEKGFKRTTTTQADRTRVGGGNIGGAPFPAISEADPAYKGKVWGVMDEGTAARLKNLTTDDTAWTTMLGSANQLKTNPIVFDKLKRGFITSMKQGNLSPELAGKINHNLALTFGEGADIRDPKIWRQADTFEKRAALADVMMGQGTAPSKGGIAIGGEKSGKGVIFKPTDILKRETEPSLLHTEHGGDVPTFAAGPRLFRLNKESVYDPSLHPGFPTLLTGEDLKINMKPTPTEVYLRDWHAKFKKDNPERKSPGYYDLALGVKGEGLPSQELNDEYIRHLLREGFKKGGKVDIQASDRRLAQAIEKRMAKGGKVDIEASDARLQAAIDARMGMAKGGEVGFKKIEFMADGGKLVKGGTKVMKKLFADPVLPTAERDANLAKFLEPSKVTERLYHGTTATEGGKRNEAIRRLKPSKEGALGSGVYMTPNTAHASGYSNIPNDEAIASMLASKYHQDTGLKALNQRNSGELLPAQEGGNMLPVHAQLRNPLIIGKSGRNIDPAADALMSLGMDEESAIRLVERAFEEKGNIGKQIQSRAQAQGYDGIMQYRGDDLSEVVSYRPNAVKSAIGNRGTYDINEPDLSKAHGGIAHMDKGGKAGKLASGIANVGKRLMADAPTEKKIIQPPSIIIPSKIGNVKEAARKSGGEYGAKRVERAADEIPNLEKLYKEEALRQAFVGDNARGVMTMNPKDFENYAIPLQPRFTDKNSTRYTTSGERLDYPEYMSEYLPNVGAFNDVPFLLINKEEQGLPLVPFISGHEGRHRNRVMAGKGEQAGLVQLLPRSELREPFPRRHQDEYIEALREELKMTDDMVLPERFTGEFSDKIIRRPAVKLPDVYAKGGLTMAGGGSIQENLKNIQNYSVLDKGATRKPNELGGVVLAGASWMAGDEKTKLAKQLFGDEVTNTAIGGQKTSDVLKQLNEFKGNGGTFAPNTTVVLDIGANDIAQGVDESVIRNNLNEIVSRLGEEGVHVILSGQPEAHSYDEAIKSTTLQMDDLYSDIASNNPNVTLVDAMSGMLNDKTLMDESGFHLNSDEAKLAYLSQFADANKARETNNQSVVDIPKQIEQITQTSKPEERYAPESQVDFTPAVVQSQPSAGYTYAQNNSSIDNYYNVINDYLAQERTQDEIQAAMEQYGVSQADIDAARDYQPSGGSKTDESYATAQYANGGSAFKTIQWQKPQRFDGGGIASPEEVNPFEGSRREPLLTKKDWENIKRNAPEVYDWAKQNVKDEASQLKSARGVKDFALRTGAQYLGGIPDLVNLGLMGVDALADTNLSSEKPWFGSEQYIDALKRSGAVGENEFPIAETIAGVLAPAGLIKKGVKKIGGMKPAKEAPKKRRGGLTAMSQ